MRTTSAMRFPVSVLFMLAGFGFTVIVIGASVSPNTGKKTIFNPKNKPASRDGLTGDICRSSSDCSFSRLCVDIPNRAICSASSEECRCIPSSGVQSCTSSLDCGTGEGCVTINSYDLCGSCEAIATEGLPFVDDGGDCLSSNDEASCVSVRHLQHLSSSDLVFAEHRRAPVLCDSRNSCATPGHIVVYQSHTMTMQRYCRITPKGCSRRVMEVNSPRMRYGLRIDTFTEGLKFTPLSAKYETGLEEAVLNVLVRFGM